MSTIVRYFDHAATTAVKEEVLNEMLPYFVQNYGNASSLYSVGRKSKKALDEARIKVANVLNCNPKEIYFTSCGSESNNLAIKGFAYANKNLGTHIITSKIEHPSVLNTCKKLEEQGYRVTYLNVDKDGLIDLKELEDSITSSTILITIMIANNEIGTIQPIYEIAKIAKKHNIRFHTDAVQAAGTIKIDVQEMGIDMLSLSAHKFYGPKGMGALYVKNDINFEKIQDGGHQEKDKRAGTENIAGIVGLGKALELANNNIESYTNKMLDLREYYISEITKTIPNVKLNGHFERRLPGNANMSFVGVDAEGLLLKLDERGICASAGSACSSGSALPSHVLMAIGLDEKLAGSSLRITFGDENTIEDVKYLINSIKEIVEELRML
ncbi:MAG: cysteine desulfurase [Lachnospiraceae bacterium]|jgi:cysteine desulfurase|nr:cysteine desulfurase [Lachnospiraceae bacterium]